MSERDASTGLPEIELFSHHDGGGDAIELLRESAGRVVEKCLVRKGSRSECILPELEKIEVSLISDAAIAAVHVEFMDDSASTDVITFPHGEILISLETAARNAPVHGTSPGREALLYLIHGLLHLNGFDDRTPEWRQEMEEAQEEILGEIYPFPEAENPG